MAGQGGGETRISEIMQALAGLFRELGDIAAGLLEKAASMVEGSKLGGEVAAFYRTLVENGVPEDLARDLTEKYLEERLRLASKVFEAVERMTRSGGGNPAVIAVPAATKNVDAAQLEALAKAIQAARTAAGSAAEEEK